MRVRGIDGCRGGWLAATVDATTGVAWTWTRDVAALLHDPTVDAVAIDIPIGLPDAGTRACDREARALLGRRGVSVFAAPVRPVLDCSSYGDARVLLAAAGGPSMSAQAWGIVAAVRAVDDAVSPADEDRVVEAHPELAFARMNGGAALPGKRTTAGVATRLRLLSTWRDDVLDALAEAPPESGLDDALDALACAWVAQRWAAGAGVVLGDGARDRHGLVMRIVSGSP